MKRLFDLIAGACAGLVLLLPLVLGTTREADGARQLADLLADVL